MFELIVAIILIYLACYVLIPFGAVVGGIALVIVAGVAVIVGFFTAFANYIKAVRENINFRNWEWEKDDEPAKRSYFFGPGYAQLTGTIKKAFELNALSGEKVSTTAKGFKGDSDGIWGGIKHLLFRTLFPGNLPFRSRQGRILKKTFREKGLEERRADGLWRWRK